MAAPEDFAMIFFLEIPMHTLAVYLPLFPAEVFPTFCGRVRPLLFAL